MNPHHPGHTTAYSHHPSLSSSPHHPGPGSGHHGSYGTGNNSSSGGSGGGSTSTPDLPSPHSPQSHSGQNDPGTPYGSIGTPGMGSNGHHHGMSDNQHHPVHTHPHLPGHPAYPPVNHNNNCTLKQEGGHQGSAVTQTCAGCGGRITERYFLHALDRYWHNSCFKCHYCQHPLADMGTSCFTKHGMVLCKNDYSRLYAASTQCVGCRETIGPHEYVTKSNGNAFHVKCFCCSKCGETLLVGAKYFMMSGQPVCEPDWLKMIKTSTVGQSGGVQTIAGNGGAPQRKNKVGRPRRSRE